MWFNKLKSILSVRSKLATFVCSTPLPRIFHCCKMALAGSVLYCHGRHGGVPLRLRQRHYDYDHCPEAFPFLLKFTPSSAMLRTIVCANCKIQSPPYQTNILNRTGASYGCSFVHTSFQWRMPLALQVVPGLILLVGACFSPNRFDGSKAGRLGIDIASSTTPSCRQVEFKFRPVRISSNPRTDEKGRNTGPRARTSAGLSAENVEEKIVPRGGNLVNAQLDRD